MAGLFFAAMDTAAWLLIPIKSARHTHNACDGRLVLELASSCVSDPVGEDLFCDLIAGQLAGTVDGVAEWLQAEG